MTIIFLNMNRNILAAQAQLHQRGTFVQSQQSPSIRLQGSKSHQQSSNNIDSQSALLREASPYAIYGGPGATKEMEQSIGSDQKMTRVTSDRLQSNQTNLLQALAEAAINSTANRARSNPRSMVSSQVNKKTVNLHRKQSNRPQVSSQRRDLVEAAQKYQMYAGPTQDNFSDFRRQMASGPQTGNVRSVALTFVNTGETNGYGLSQYTSQVNKDTPKRPERDLSYDSARMASDSSQRRVSFAAPRVTMANQTLEAGKLAIRDVSRRRGAQTQALSTGVNKPNKLQTIANQTASAYGQKLVPQSSAVSGNSASRARSNFRSNNRTSNLPLSLAKAKQAFQKSPLRPNRAVSQNRYSQQARNRADVVMQVVDQQLTALLDKKGSQKQISQSLATDQAVKIGSGAPVASIEKRSAIVAQRHLASVEYESGLNKNAGTTNNRFQATKKRRNLGSKPKEGNATLSLPETGPSQLISQNSNIPPESEYHQVLSDAIKNDQQVLKSIEQDWNEVNSRLQQRASLLQTLQHTNDDAFGAPRPSNRYDIIEEQKEEMGQVNESNNIVLESGLFHVQNNLKQSQSIKSMEKEEIQQQKQVSHKNKNPTQTNGQNSPDPRMRQQQDIKRLTNVYRSQGKTGTSLPQTAQQSVPRQRAVRVTTRRVTDGRPVQVGGVTLNKKNPAILDHNARKRTVEPPRAGSRQTQINPQLALISNETALQSASVIQMEGKLANNRPGRTLVYKSSKNKLDSAAFETRSNQGSRARTKHPNNSQISQNVVAVANDIQSMIRSVGQTSQGTSGGSISQKFSSVDPQRAHLKKKRIEGYGMEPYSLNQGKREFNTVITESGGRERLGTVRLSSTGPSQANQVINATIAAISGTNVSKRGQSKSTMRSKQRDEKLVTGSVSVGRQRPPIATGATAVSQNAIVPRISQKSRRVIPETRVQRPAQVQLRKIIADTSNERAKRSLNYNSSQTKKQKKQMLSYHDKIAVSQQPQHVKFPSDMNPNQLMSAEMDMSNPNQMNLSLSSKPEPQNESAVLMNSPKQLPDNYKFLQVKENELFSPSSLEQTNQGLQDDKLINIVIGESNLNDVKQPIKKENAVIMRPKEIAPKAIISNQYSFQNKTKLTDSYLQDVKAINKAREKQIMSTGAAIVDGDREELEQEPAVMAQEHNMSPPLHLEQFRTGVANESELILKARDKQIISQDVKKNSLSFIGQGEYEEVNETINSSKLIMNKRDRKNIQEFLSANISPKALIKEISGTNLLNDSVVQMQGSEMNVLLTGDNSIIVKNSQPKKLVPFSDDQEDREQHETQNEEAYRPMVLKTQQQYSSDQQQSKHRPTMSNSTVNRTKPETSFNTINSHLATRKSTFLFGTKRNDLIISQNNLRYSQQVPQLAQQNSNQQQQNELLLSGTNPVDCTQDKISPLKPTSDDNKFSGNVMKERCKRYDEVVMSRAIMEKVSDQITENYAEEQDHTSTSRAALSKKEPSRMSHKASEMSNEVLMESMNSSSNAAETPFGDKAKAIKNNFMDTPRSEIPSELSIKLKESVDLNPNSGNAESSGKNEWPEQGHLQSASSKSIKPSQSVHSDDEVASRRGLEVEMSQDKLAILQQEFDEINMRTDTKTGKREIEEAVLSIDLNEQALQASIIASGVDKPMITPRLFKDKVGEKSLSRNASDSACLMGSSSEESVKNVGRYNQLNETRDSPNRAMQSLMKLNFN